MKAIDLSVPEQEPAPEGGLYILALPATVFTKLSEVAVAQGTTVSVLVAGAIDKILLEHKVKRG